jgi:uncharacterized membrane protein YbhN (UPF0104 family)
LGAVSSPDAGDRGGGAISTELAAEPPIADATPPVEAAAEPAAGPTSLGRMLLRSLLGVSVGLLVACIAGYLGDVKLSEVAKSFAGVPAWAVGACAASGFVMFALQSLRWHAVMKPLLGLRYGQAYRAQVVGYMFNAVLPARGGDLLRVQYLGRRTGKSRATILGTEVVDRWLDFWGWIPTVLVLAIVSDVPSWIYKALGIFGGLLIAWGGTMVVLSRRGFAPRPGSRVAALYGAFRAGVEVFSSKRILGIALGIAPLSWMWEAFAIHGITPAFDIHLTLTQAFCVLIGFNLAMVVPSPGAIGTQETGGTLALRVFGVDSSRALAFMVVYHLAQLVPGIVAGVVILATEGERLFGGEPVKPPSGAAST